MMSPQTPCARMTPRGEALPDCSRMANLDPNRNLALPLHSAVAEALSSSPPLRAPTPSRHRSRALAQTWLNRLPSKKRRRVRLLRPSAVLLDRVLPRAASHDRCRTQLEQSWLSRSSAEDSAYASCLAVGTHS